MGQTRRSWTVDSIEEGIALVDEGGRMVRVPAWLLPDGVREGEILAVTREQEGERVTLAIERDTEATARALAASRAQLAQPAPVVDPGGDIVL